MKVSSEKQTIMYRPLFIFSKFLKPSPEKIKAYLKKLSIMQAITYTIITGGGNTSHQPNRELSKPWTFLAGRSHLAKHENLATEQQ